MIYKLGFQKIHLRIYDKLFSLSGLISAHRRESWVGVTLASWLYKTGRLPSSHRQLKTGCSFRSFKGSSELFGLQYNGYKHSESVQVLGTINNTAIIKVIFIQKTTGNLDYANDGGNFPKAVKTFKTEF